MALFPIYGVFKGDFVPHLVAVDTEDTMSTVAEKIAVHAIGRRLPAETKAKGYEVTIDDDVIPASKTFGEVLGERQLAPLHWVIVQWKQ
jgi:toluene monooxygenase system protein B